jgi:hypothetical protein
MTKEAEFLYDIAVSHEIYPDDPDGESLAILEMLAEIRELGYPYEHFADIELRSIKDKKVMDILVKYYPRMESLFTKEAILKKIDPKKFPVAIEWALVEYNELSPFEKHEMSGLQEVIAKGKPSEEYLDFLLSLVSTPDTYFAGFLIRERLVRSAPEKLRPYTFEFYNGVLLMDTLKEFARYGDAESENMLRRAKDITEAEVLEIHKKQSYKMCVTMYEKCKSYCTAENIRYEAKRLLRKLEKKKNESTH